MDRMRQQLVEQLISEGIHDETVLAAIGTVPRELFVEDSLQEVAYADEALPIQCGQTISQPYIVAKMSELLLQAGPVKKVLEIGTGSGYQAAVLAQIVNEVYSVERIKTLLNQANQRFKQLQLTNVHTLYGDGFLGWEEFAPYDGILVTAAAPTIPETLTDQLADGGRLIMPVGMPYDMQRLCIVQKKGKELLLEYSDTVLFVPMITGIEE